MSRFSGLPSAIAAKAKADPTPEDEEMDDEEDCESSPASKKKEPKMNDDKTAAAIDAARKEGHDAGFKAASDRFNAVMASEHYEGREAQAKAMLGKTALAASDIIELLAAAPKAAPTASDDAAVKEAAEAAARAEMQASIAQTGNSNIDAGNDAAPDKDAAISAGYDRAVAKVNKLNGY
jgi:hypothetical protein